MKKITSFLSILIVLISFQIKAQNVTVYPSYKWGVGFNIGHLFECSDVRWEPGFGYGFTLQRFLNPDTDGFFNVSIRGRLLNGTSFGQDWIKSEGLLKNTALNGITDNKMDYSSSPGFVFSNHRTEISELSAEAVFYANKLRREKRILFYFWGGIGVTEFTTYINQLNSNALKYDYTLITADKKKDILNELDVLLDDDYETFADGVTAEANTFTTNLGIGLGYMITPSLSIALEHKISFTSTDILDGQKWTNENELTGDNDIYHYTNLGFTFYFNKTRKTPKPKPVIVEKNKKPVIIINQPKKTPYQSPDCKTEIIATVLNVDTKEQIDVFANGGKLQKSNYNFFAKNKRLTIHKEIKESTTFKITATNDYGSSSKVRVIYCKQAPQKQKPIVKIVKPYSNPYLSEECFALVKAKVENIYDKNNIKVSENGNYLLSSEFSFDVSTGELEFSKSISKISNFKILATNEMGSDFDEVSIHCRGKGKKPEINVVQPNTSIVETTDCNARISARIYNIDSKQDVSISLNGSQLNSSKFDYNSSTKNLRLNTAFSGESVFVIKASNKYGYAKARITFLCKSKNRKPFVKITKPYVNPFRTEKFEANIIADVLNVDSKNNIRVTENAVTLSQYLYDFNPERHILTLNKSIKNTSVFKITATNETGTASDDVTIIAVKKAKKMPVVTINNPSTNPYVSANCNAYITATIINVEDNNNIKVTQDNFTLLPSAYKFSPSTNLLQIQRKLSEDSEFKITATNSSGSASASVLIKCTKKIELKPTVVITKPTSTFYSSEDCKANIKATIRNVNSKSQITVTENANVISQNKYSYNLNSQVLSLMKDVSATSKFKITAKNSAGSSSALVTIKCIKNIKLKPSVTITQPTSTFYNSEDCKANIKATILGVESKSQITVTENANVISQNKYSYNLNSQVLSFTKDISATSKFKITAKNSAGSSSDIVNIKCIKKFKPLPEVTVIKPVKEVYSTEKCVADVLVKIKNVNSKSQLSVSENKKLLSQNEFSYNAETMLLSFKRDVSDESMFFIKATNSAGSASDVVTIKCIIKPKPQVTITQPSSKFFSTGNCEANIKATILNIDSKSQITVKENGKSIPASLFTFNNKVLSLKKKVATTSKFEITATNSSGLASDVVNIKCVIPVKKPVVKITKPQKNPYVTEQNIQNFTAQVWNIKKVSQITVLASGKKVTTLDFNSKTGILNFKLSLQSDKTTVVVTVSNSAGSSSDQLTVIYNSPFRKPVINILRPTENPYKPANCLADVLAEILYVDDISKIIVTENGKSIESFYLTFDKKENTIRIYKDVYPSSKFVFKATNKHGTTTKEVTINCK